MGDRLDPPHPAGGDGAVLPEAQGLSGAGKGDPSLVQPVVPALPGGSQRLVEPLQSRQPHLLLHLHVVDPRVPCRRELALRHPPQSPCELGAHLVPVGDRLHPSIPCSCYLALSHLHERANKFTATILLLNYNLHPVTPRSKQCSFHPEPDCST